MFKLIQINFVLTVFLFSLIPFKLFGFIGISGQKQNYRISETHPKFPTKQTSIEKFQCQNDGNKCTNLVTKEVWNLVESDEFDYWERSDLYKNWDVDHNVNGDCLGSLKISCNSGTNVEFSNGKLFLTAKYEGDQYTSAAINSRTFFGEGRYEIKAQLPFADGVRASILTKNFQEDNYHQFGIMSYIQTQILYRTVRTQEGAYGFDDLAVDDLKGFHRFGVEWNRTHARFIFDDNYGNVFRVKNGELNPQQQIRLQISVGGIYFLPSRSLKCNPYILTDCKHGHAYFSQTRQSMRSQFVIDYVRIYQKQIYHL